MNREEWFALAERAKELKCGNYDFDEALLRALGGQVRRVSRLGLSGRTPGSDRWFPPGTTSLQGYPVPRLTRSIDDISLVVKSALQGWSRICGEVAPKHAHDDLRAGCFAILAPQSSAIDEFKADACASEAIALCAALCLAKAEQAGGVS